MENLLPIKVNKNYNPTKFNKNSNPINLLNTDKENIPSLPNDFVETVLDCEIKLKEKFNIKVFQKLANYYSAAVAYYERINDPKYIAYNQSLSLLFSNEDAKKYLAGGEIKEKLKKDKIKKKIQNCDKKVSDDKVKNFIKRNGSANSKKIINNLINKDMDIQQNEFKKRLAEKKKRFKLSISDNVINNDIGKAFKNIGINSINISESNVSLDSIFDKEIKISEKDTSNLNSLTNNTLSDKNISNRNSDNSNNNILDDLKNEENSTNNIMIGNSSHNKLDFSSETNCNNEEINKNNLKFTNKTMFLEKMKFNFEIYSNDYYDYFIKKISSQIIKDYNSNFIDLTQILMDMTVNSYNQEKELNFLLTSDSEETYKQEINTIIQQLIEEEKIYKEKMISENNEKLDKIKGKYLGPLNSFQSDHDIEMFKERLKLDITKSLNNLVFK